MSTIDWRPAVEWSLEHLAETLLAQIPLIPAGWQEASSELSASLRRARLTREIVLERRAARVSVSEGESLPHERLWQECSTLLADWLDTRQPAWRDELSWRVRPLEEQWRMRGAGFVRAWQRRFSVLQRTDSPPTSIIVHVVTPCRGGFGTLLDASPSLLLEGLLTDVDPRLPEIARLAWLVTMGLIAFDERLPIEHTANLLSQRATADSLLAWRALLTMAVLVADLEWFPIDTSLIVRAASQWSITTFTRSETACRASLDTLLATHNADRQQVLDCVKQLET